MCLCVFHGVGSVQWLSCVWLWPPWTAARQASLSITNSQGLLKLMSNKSDMCPTNQCHPTISSSVIPFSSCLQCFPASGSFQWVSFSYQVASIGVSASASVLPMNIQDWFPLGLTDLISLLSKELSRVFFSTTVRKHQSFRLVSKNNYWVKMIK